ncbi:permease [Prochlorococcus marinus XMU1403]|uniref:AEC family transporter n=1 Tax=Prochlorococcus marinus TaxID=1219 RepID=UPI000D92D5A7|nr:AEC family transporter [Prochlorococcus marinus]MBW3049512.1 permease [Prochlorococcus marinus str. MU1403]PYE01744.1 permease [Prochlorococcus marinus XMU1403]
MEIILLLSELIPCLLIGYLLGRFKENLSLTISRPLISYGIPISLMGILLKSGLELPLIESAALALVAIGFLMTILNRLPSVNNLIQNRTLQLGSAFGNTGYFGIPVSLALLPDHALIYSIGFDLGATLVIWSLGPILLTDPSKVISSNRYWKNFIKGIFSSPAVKGLIGALIIHSSPWDEQITDLLWIPSRVVIVLALVIVGMRLSWLRKANLSRIKNQITSIKNALIMKLVGLPVIMLIISSAIRLPSVMREALVLQAAAPTAISILLISQAASRDEKEATSLVVFSTITALISIPAWLLILRL